MSTRRRVVVCRGRVVLSTWATSLALCLILSATPALAQCEIAALRANDGKPGDRFGGSVSLDGDSLVVGARNDNDMGMVAGAAYIFRRNATEWVEEAKLTAPDGAEFDYFGNCVAISGDYIVIGAPHDDDGGSSAGSVYVFRHGTLEWVLATKLTASDGQQHNYFGNSVSIENDTIMVGAPGRLVGSSGPGHPTRSGSVYVFHRNKANWVEEAKLVAADGAAGDSFGYSVAVIGNLVVIGAPLDDDAGTDSGSAYIFRRNGTNWVEEAKLVAADGASVDLFGASVSINGDSAVIGAYVDDDACRGNPCNASGSVYVYRHNGWNWSEEAKLVAKDAAAQDVLGFSVSIDGDILVAGARSKSDFGLESGAAYVFRRHGMTWTEEAKLWASDAHASRLFGFSVALNDGYVAVGAPWTSYGVGPGATGAAYVSRVLGRPDCDADGVNDDCEPDCNGNGVADDCDLVDGTSEDCNWNDFPDECEPDKDCNGNAIQDICDLAEGISGDCNGNGIPDECEPDCNENGVADSCDIANGTSGDCNGNRLPDECDIAVGGSEDGEGNQVPDECESINAPFFALVPVLPPPSVGPYPPGVTVIGKEILLPAGGGRVWLEIKLGGWAPNDLCVSRATIDSTGYVSGPGEPLAPAMELCDETGFRPDDTCETAFGPASRCEGGACLAGFQDRGRSDYAFRFSSRHVDTSTTDYSYSSTFCLRAYPKNSPDA